MTFLARTSFLGFARESTNGTPVTPTTAFPFTKAQYETTFTPLRDESVRGNDAVLQGLYQGPADGTWDIETHFYPDLTGFWLRTLGPDTVTGGLSTTLTSSPSAGATAFTVAVATTTGQIIQIGTGATQEWATVTVGGTSTTIGAPGLLYAHTSSEPVVAQYTHTFAQSTTTRPPSFTFTVFDNIDYRAWPGAMATELGIKIDPAGTVTFNPKFVSFPEQTASSFTDTFTSIQPFLGWEWTVTNAGGTSTRGLTMDLTFKRDGMGIHSSNGLQAPRETFVGALVLDGSYKAIYENLTDYNLFLNYTQTPTVHTLTKPVSKGGESLALTMSQSGYSKGARDLSQTYVQATFDVSAIANTTDGGIAKAVLKNYISAQY
jgi:hypothetical protein